MFLFVLLFLLLPLSVAGAGCAVGAAMRSRDPAPAFRAGHRVLALLCALTLAAFLFSAGDWVHTQWNVQYPLAGLFLGAGLLLPQVWRDDRARYPDLLRGWNGAAIALSTVLALGAIPVLLMSIPIEIWSAGRETGSPLTALLEVARYGFDGTVPALMQPEHSGQIERGLGHPPRVVTVTMGSTLFAAAYWILFVVLALVGRAVPGGRPRLQFFVWAPLVIAPQSLLLSSSRATYSALWGNEPWLVRSYGPVLLVAVLATLALFITLRRDGAPRP